MEMPHFVLCVVCRLVSHRAIVVLCSPSFLVIGAAFFALDGVGLFGLLGVCFVLRVLVDEGLVA
jgi:hypothetical protein